MIPTNVAFSVTNTVRDNEMVLRDVLEQIGTFEIDVNNTGPPTEYLMNPILMTGTRLQTLSQSFQEYKFESMEMVFFPGVPSTIGGTYYMGYTTNADDVATNSPQAVALPGAKISTLWQNTQSRATLDKSSWYVVDADSTEVMKTTQGKWFIGLNGVTNLTGVLSTPVMLRYTIRFRKPTSRPAPLATGKVAFSVANYVSAATVIPTLTSGWILTASQTGPAPLPAAGYIYLFEEDYVLSVQGASAPETLSAGAVKMITTNVSGQTYNVFFFGETIADIQKGELFVCGITDTYRSNDATAYLTGLN